MVVLLALVFVSDFVVDLVLGWMYNVVVVVGIVVHVVTVDVGERNPVTEVRG